MEILSIVPATAAGFLTLTVATHPRSVIWRKTPHIKIRRIQIFPSLRIRVGGRIIHFHHWLNLSILLIVSNFISGGILTELTTKGFLLGGILQGLFLGKDNFRLIYKGPHPFVKYPKL